MVEINAINSKMAIWLLKNIKVIKSKLIVTPTIEVAIADTIVGIKQIAFCLGLLSIAQFKPHTTIVSSINGISKVQENI